MQTPVKYRPYVSIDIETTGIDDRSHVLEIGAVFEDWITPVAELPKIRLPIRWEYLEYAEVFALFLNAKLIEDIAKNNIEVFSPGNACIQFLNFLDNASAQVKEWDEANGTDKWGKGKIQFAGKNAAGFDVPKLQLLFEKLRPGKPATPHTKTEPGYFTSRFNATKMHRVIDCGSVYWKEFGYVPNLTEINKLCGKEGVAHTAVEDAIDVIIANRHMAGYKI